MHIFVRLIPRYLIVFFVLSMRPPHPSLEIPAVLLNFLIGSDSLSVNSFGFLE